MILVIVTKWHFSRSKLFPIISALEQKVRRFLYFVSSDSSQQGDNVF